MFLTLDEAVATYSFAEVSLLDKQFTNILRTSHHDQKYVQPMSLEMTIDKFESTLSQYKSVDAVADAMNNEMVHALVIARHNVTEKYLKDIRACVKRLPVKGNKGISLTDYWKEIDLIVTQEQEKWLSKLSSERAKDREV